MKAFAGAVLAASVATSAWAAEYHVLTTGDHDMAVLEKASIKTVNGYQRGWLTVIVRKPIAEMAFISSLYEGDCKQERLRNIALVSRDAHFNLIISRDTVQEWKYVEPNTQGQAVLNGLCHPETMTENNSLGDKNLSEIRQVYLDSFTPGQMGE